MTPIRTLVCALVATCSSTVALAQRLPAIPEAQQTDAQKKALTDIAAGGHAFFSPLAPMLRAPELALRAQRFGEYVYYDAPMEPRVYEVAVLLIARQLNQQFEWRVHYPKSIKVGVKQANVDAIGAGRRPPSLAADEAIMYDFVSELLKKNDVSDATYQRFVGQFGERGVVDTVGLLGYYTTIALMLNVDRTPVREGPEPIPVLKPLRKPLP